MKKSDIKILLVDDEPDILEIVGFNLKNEGYSVKTSTNGLDALESAKEQQPHIIILDIMMPEMDGIETCERLRNMNEFKDTIIVFFTARGEDFSQSAGFDAGADDYITKPIKPKILLKKIKALTRRLKETTVSDTIVKLGDITIDSGAYTVQIDDKVIPLPKKEFELLRLLSSNPGNIFKREDILNSVWSNVVVGDRTIDVHIRKLRKKLGNKYFKTQKGVGYKFVLDQDES